jgi:hypothetical protein
VNDITKTAESRRALRWLSQQLAWERVLDDLRTETTDTPERQAA